MKLIKQGVLSFALLMASFVSIVVATWSWIAPSVKVDLNGAQGYTASSYFAGGDGSPESPYIINNPIHLYNLAWLQYLGYFNETDETGSTYVQQSFILDASLDMSTYVLPPIGTTKYPFIGNFDGNGYSITNLSVSNNFSDIVKKPVIVTGLEDVNIVGMFGVVGDINNVLTATYNTSANEVKNFYIDSAAITTASSQTLVGIAAGYVNGTVEGVGVANSTIEVNGSATQYGSFTRDNNLSDYTVIGYCTDAFKTISNTATTSIKSPSTSTSQFTKEDSGDAAGWGGSIDMVSLHARLSSFTTRSGYSYFNRGALETVITYNENGQEISTTNTSGSGNEFVNFYDSSNPLLGSYTFGRYDTGTTANDFIYLSGHKIWTHKTTIRRRGPVNGFLISSGSNYLSVNISTNNTVSITNQTNSNSATAWVYDGTSGTISLLVNNVKYYLYASSTSALAISSTSSNAVSWTYSNNRLTCSYIPVWGNARTVYLRFNNSSWRVNTSSNNAATITLTSASATDFVETSSEEPNGVVSRATYFPLNVDDDYIPKINNTGYIVSGAQSTTTSVTYPYRTGDIRVSRYDFNLNNSFDGSSYNLSRWETLTRNAYSGGDVVRISDPDNQSNTSVDRDLSNFSSTKLNYDTDLHLQKYIDSKAALGPLLGRDIYGLHFMEANISMDRIIQAEQVRVNGSDYYNYDLPEDSIDFHLQDKGYINFFAGTYFSNNNSFFSLHTIERDESQKITAINEISKIYGNTTDESLPYIYQYENEAAPTLPQGYIELFDTTWIKEPRMLTQAMYYYEIPVNEGEYALGSVDDGIGAYLLYLDISANAQQINRTTFVEQITTIVNQFEYPLGVALVNSTTSSVDASNSIALALQAGFTSSINLNRTGDEVVVTATSSNYVAGYIADNIKATPSTNDDALEVIPIESSQTVINRMTYIDYNTSTGVIESVSYITDTYVDGGSAVRTSEQFTGDNLDEPVAGYENTDTIDTSGLGDTFFSYSYIYSKDGTVGVTYTLTYQEDAANEDGHYYQFTGYQIVLDPSEEITVKIDTMVGTYVITINGTSVTGVNQTIVVSPTA